MTDFFSKLVTEEFSFLLQRGFSLSIDDLDEVRFESAKSVVRVTWNRRSGELEVYMQLLHEAAGDKPYSLRDLLSMEGKDLPEAREPFQVSEQDRLRPFLKRLADDVSKYASQALAGDRMYYRRLSEFRSVQARSFMRGMQLRQARAKADEAWGLRNYEQVVEQYELIRDDLNATERKKLALAKERLH
jgi:hypothetical protein